MTAIGARWDENFELTSSYGTASVNVSSSAPSEIVAYFDHILTRDAGLANPVYAVGFYKVSAYENGVEQAYFYYDCRTSNWSASVDSYFKYDVANNRFRNDANTATIDYTVQTLWDLTNNTLETTGLENYWSNANVIMNNGSGKPRIVWGPYPSSSITIIKYKIYRLVEGGSWEYFGFVNGSTYQYTDNSVNISQFNGMDVSYKVLGVYNLTQQTAYTNTVTVNCAGSPIGKIGIDQELANKIYLQQNYPNPFNPSTLISYHLPNSNFVKVSIFNTIGEEVSVLVSEMQDEGDYSVEFNASSLPSGVYFYRIEAGQFTEIKKMILMR